MGVSEAKKKANNKYVAKAYDYVGLHIKKAEMPVIKQHVSARGESANSFFNRAAMTQIAVDTGAVELVGEVPPLGTVSEGGEV